MPKLLGQILTQQQTLSTERLDVALTGARQHNLPLGEYLIAQVGFSQENVYRALAVQFGMEFVADITHEVSDTLVRELPGELFLNGRCLPLRTSTDLLLVLAVDDPLNLDAVLSARIYADCEVIAVLTTPSQLDQQLQINFEGDAALRQSAGRISLEYEHQIGKAEHELTLDEIRKRTEAEPVVKMAALIFEQAIKLNASDIHIEPGEHEALVRYRIDGMLKQHMELSRWMFLPLTSRIKIMANLDIAEKRMPQDGRIRHELAGGTYDFRVSTLPTHHGEKTVIRILKHDKKLLDLDNLGIPAREREQLRELMEKPQGVLFVTGPTGSGKSSTLFAGLNTIKHKEINITTIENPIEYKLDGINQVQINEKAGVTFASSLRSILRQDPDVILIGEIRDKETADIAIQASQTGHLVLSTLHTNDSVSAINRLRDLGIPSFLIGAALIGILAQRLVRVLCPVCKSDTATDSDVVRRWELLLPSLPFPRACRPVGCEKCNATGYKGRTGIYELIVINETLRTMISENATDSQIRTYLFASGVQTLIQNGIRTIEQGITSAEELLRVVLVEDVIQINAQKQ